MHAPHPAGLGVIRECHSTIVLRSREPLVFWDAATPRLLSVLPPAPGGTAGHLTPHSICWHVSDGTMVTVARRIATGRCLQLDSSRRFNGTFAIRPAVITPIRPSRRSVATRPVATAAGLPADPIPSELRAAAADASDVYDTEQRQRELRPFLVPSPTRGTTNSTRGHLPFSRPAMLEKSIEVAIIPPSRCTHCVR